MQSPKFQTYIVHRWLYNLQKPKTNFITGSWIQVLTFTGQHGGWQGISDFCLHFVLIFALVIVIQPCRASSTLARFVTAPKAKASQRSRQRWKSIDLWMKAKTFLVCFPAGKSTTPAHGAWTRGAGQGEDLRHHQGLSFTLLLGGLKNEDI